MLILPLTCVFSLHRWLSWAYEYGVSLVSWRTSVWSVSCWVMPVASSLHTIQDSYLRFWDWTFYFSNVSWTSSSYQWLSGFSLLTLHTNDLSEHSHYTLLTHSPSTHIVFLHEVRFARKENFLKINSKTDEFAQNCRFIIHAGVSSRAARNTITRDLNRRLRPIGLFFMLSFVLCGMRMLGNMLKGSACVTASCVLCPAGDIGSTTGHYMSSNARQRMDKYCTKHFHMTRLSYILVRLFVDLINWLTEWIFVYKYLDADIMTVSRRTNCASAASSFLPFYQLESVFFFF